jgi:hypothetical protein
MGIPAHYLNGVVCFSKILMVEIVESKYCEHHFVANNQCNGGKHRPPFITGKDPSYKKEDIGQYSKGSSKAEDSYEPYLLGAYD